MTNKSNRNARKKIPLAQRRKARQLVMQALYQWVMADAEPTKIAEQFHDQNEGKIDWEYFDEVFIEIPKCVQSLDEHLVPVLDRSPDALDPIEKSLLYLGTYELSRRVDVPYKVVINECIELAKVFGATDSHKYVNGVLDKLAVELRPAEIAKK
ncbi:MAG: transcription antitermination factor NusB [Pseudomonadales bacterium]|nr:transcription antitermination factor NusB [Pseudomonadales bacterium]